MKLRIVLIDMMPISDASIALEVAIRRQRGDVDRVLCQLVERNAAEAEEFVRCRQRTLHHIIDVLLLLLSWKTSNMSTKYILFMNYQRNKQ